MPSKPIPRWLPRVRLYERPRSSRAAWAAFWMSDQLKAQSQARPGQTTGLRWIYPTPREEQKFDGNPGEPQSLKAAAITLDYELQWLPTRLGGAFGWVRLRTPDEAAFRAIDRAIAQNEMERLQGELEEKPDDENLQAQLLAAETTYYQLTDGQDGYCRTGEWLMNTGVSGLFWGLNAPNVPVRFVSSFVLPQDGAFSLRLRRDKLPEEQVEGVYSILVFTDKGDKSTAYRITIGDDGNSSEFFHYRSMSRKKREALQAQLDALDARGHLTAGDHATLKLYKEEQLSIQAKAKKEGRKDLSREEKAQIELLDAKARALKESRKNTAAEKAQMAALEKQLYIERRAFRLQEDAQSLLGQTLDITIQFLRAGFVIVRCKDSEFVYTNERAQDASARRRYGTFTTQLPDKARIQIDSSGGMWALVYGRPKFNATGFALGQLVELPAGATPADVETAYDGDESGGGAIEVALVPFPEARGRNLYQVLLRLSSDSGRFTPEVYRADFHLPATPAPEFGASAWDSQTPGNAAAASGNRILDVVVESENNRTLQAKVTVPARELPVGAAALACDVRIHDRWGETGDGSHDTTQMRMGQVASNVVQRAAQMDESGLGVLFGAMAELTAVGCDNWLDTEIKAPFPCDGLTVGTALRMCCRDAEMPDSLYAGIVEGSGPAIEGSVPGTWPLWVPGAGVRYLEFMHRLVRDCAPGWELFVTADGLSFGQWSQRDKTAKNYGHYPEVALGSPLRLMGETSTFTQDVTHYLTSITIIGERDSLTGKRYLASERLPLAEDAAFADSLYQVGHARHETRRASGLQSDTACLLAARHALGISPLMPDGLAPWFYEGQIAYDPDFRCGDVVRIGGLKFIAESVKFASLAAEEDAQKLNFRAQLAQDVRITP